LTFFEKEEGMEVYCRWKWQTCHTNTNSEAQDDARPDAMIVNVLLVYTIASWLLEF